MDVVSVSVNHKFPLLVELKIETKGGEIHTFRMENEIARILAKALLRR